MTKVLEYTGSKPEIIGDDSFVSLLNLFHKQLDLLKEARGRQKIVVQAGTKITERDLQGRVERTQQNDL